MKEVELCLISQSQMTIYQDVTVVCEDKILLLVKPLLAMAYPLMTELLRDREEHITVLMPGFKAKDVNARVKMVMAGTLKNDQNDELLDDSRGR